ncbi:Pentachlorophenol 4-monooxygenase [Grifola frondosa]|uniref:Pentachlorophenol 4-monooxygenase n=1 Tax=Grifola frondosa TaxID=5627 RepID=A0A1C7ME55_GRIFR|nr:Pentachlorophenol 4-monooxygenase [Grifola frondosa]
MSLVDSLPETTDVLIVGAGPVGLALALSLQDQGCADVTVVDSILQGENTSRALVVHAATLEALENIDCADALIEAGYLTTAISIWTGKSFIHPAAFDALAPYTKYPFVLVVPQHITESVLGAKVRERGINVFRPHKVVDLKPNERDNQITDVIFEDGKVIHARCVVGADGVKSTVRQIAGVGWADPDGENIDETGQILSQMVMADVVFDGPLPFSHDSVIGILSRNNLFLSGSRIRSVCLRNAPSTEYLQSLVDAWGPNNMKVSFEDSPKVTISKNLWSTRFRTHSAIADTFFTRLGANTPVSEEPSSEGGVILLLGDAAHIHSPAGGQGMNLGIRDAISLGPILAEYILPSGVTLGDPDSPLRTWATARRERALGIIRLTKQILSLMSMQDETTKVLGFIPINYASIRNAVMGFITKSRWVRMMLSWRLSGLGNSHIVLLFYVL